ncbi:hypothetical protein ACAW63_19195 [Pseudomonas sp. QE6]|uniref:hypothetical protein n=1 Tax=Pseudomonas sp. QE6 TaxID=3242491 RepID=UPI0035294D9C
MNNLKTCLTAIAFVLSGVAVHVNAAEKSCADGDICFQLAPMASENGVPQLAEDGFSRTPLGTHLSPEEPAQQTLAADGFGKTPLGKHLVGKQDSSVA